MEAIQFQNSIKEWGEKVTQICHNMHSHFNICCRSCVSMPIKTMTNANPPANRSLQWTASSVQTHIIFYIVYYIELCCTVQLRSPEGQFKQNKWACGRLRKSFCRIIFILYLNSKVDMTLLHCFIQFVEMAENIDLWGHRGFDLLPTKCHQFIFESKRPNLKRVTHLPSWEGTHLASDNAET